MESSLWLIWGSTAMVLALPRSLLPIGRFRNEQALGPGYREPEGANAVAGSIGDIQSPLAAFRHLAVHVSQYLAG